MGAGASFAFSFYYLNLTNTRQTKNPANKAGLDAVERVNLFEQDHLLGLPEFSSLDRIKIYTG